MWIKLHRSLLDWEWFDKSEIVHLFIYLLLKANYEDTQWKGITVKRGQLVTTRQQISRDLGLTEQQVRTVISKLILTHEINQQTTNKFTIITICKYDSYQPSKPTLQPTLQPTNNQQITSNIRSKEIKEKDNNINIIIQKEKSGTDIEKRMESFRETLSQFRSQYSSVMLEEFFSYWSEPNKSKTKMRYELERTWDTSRRLQYWERRSHQSRRNSKQDANAYAMRKFAETYQGMDK